MFKNAQDSCPNVVQQVDLLPPLPASSADCEQGFSLTKVIKSDWRSRLRDTMVTDLMTVQLHIVSDYLLVSSLVVMRTIQYALSKEDGTKDNERSYYGSLHSSYRTHT